MIMEKTSVKPPPKKMPIYLIASFTIIVVVCIYTAYVLITTDKQTLRLGQKNTLTMSPTATIMPADTKTNTPSPTPIPSPESANYLPQGIIPILNEDGTWEIGLTKGEDIVPIQGSMIDSNGLHFIFLNNQKLDINKEEFSNRIRLGESGNLEIFDENGKFLYSYSPVRRRMINWRESVLSTGEMEQLGLVGDANRIKVNYNGIDMSVILIVSPLAQKIYFDDHGVTLNEEVETIGIDPGTNLAKFILMGHYLGYMEDHSFNSNTYPFVNFIKDLKNNKDLRYNIWGVDRKTNKAGNIKIDPNKEVQIVYTGFNADPNGDSIVYLSPNARFGYSLTANGSLRTTFNFPRGDQTISDYIANGNSVIALVFWMLGTSEVEQRNYYDKIIYWPGSTADELYYLLNTIHNGWIYPIFKER
jgi:hypothetical protein